MIRSPGYLKQIDCCDAIVAGRTPPRCIGRCSCRSRYAIKPPKDHGRNEPTKGVDEAGGGKRGTIGQTVFGPYPWAVFSGIVPQEL